MKLKNRLLGRPTCEQKNVSKHFFFLKIFFLIHLVPIKKVFLQSLDVIQFHVWLLIPEREKCKYWPWSGLSDFFVPLFTVQEAALILIDFACWPIWKKKGSGNAGQTCRLSQSFGICVSNWTTTARVSDVITLPCRCCYLGPGPARPGFELWHCTWTQDLQTMFWKGSPR